LAFLLAAGCAVTSFCPVFAAPADSPVTRLPATEIVASDQNSALSVGPQAVGPADAKVANERESMSGASSSPDSPGSGLIRRLPAVAPSPKPIDFEIFDSARSRVDGQAIREPDSGAAANRQTGDETGARRGSEMSATAEGASSKSGPSIWNVYISNPQAAAPPAAPVTIYNVPPSEPVPIDPQRQRRERIAAQVSDEILSGVSNPASLQTPTPVSESLTSVQLLRECENRSATADRLLRSGATFAAKEESLAAIRCFSAALDLQRGGRDATEALEDAMREAGDFLGRYGTLDAAGVQRMVASHETPVLKNRDTSELTPHAAADVYLDYARINLGKAVQGNAKGARLLMLLANSQRARGAGDENMSDAIAITCLRAAVGSSPDDALLASELGYHAMRAGLLGEAKWALQRSLAIRPSTPALQNLIETHRLAGDLDRARELVAMLPPGTPPVTQPTMLVTTVSPTTFASISPPVQNQQPSLVPTATGLQSNTMQPAQNAAMQPFPSPPMNNQVRPGQQSANGPGQQSTNGEGTSVLDRVANAVKQAWR
jgi:tetratricopeptide (TPR) repeat protein